MNQTQKRLSIIKLAISITDIETIQLQILKLSPIRTDTKIQEILSLLQAGSYAQAQGLITDYIDSAPEEILQRTSQHSKPTITAEEQAIIDEFGLLATPSSSNEVKAIDINDYASTEAKITSSKPTVDYDALLSLEADDILPNNIDISQTRKVFSDEVFSDEVFSDEVFSDEVSLDHDSFFTKDDNTYTPELELTDIPKDTFFEDEVEVEEIIEILPIQESDEEEPSSTKDGKTMKKDIFNTPITKISIPLSYDAMPHISQKLITMRKRYPLIQINYEKFDTVESFLTKITQDGYSEGEIEEMIVYINKLIKKTKYTEAAQLLLVCAATESKFAQFMLARELYKGSVLRKNISEAFTLMNALAIYDYPEALCDLGQFYENGIGTTPDLMKAEELYKEAVNLDIKRAKKHYTRLKKHNRGLLKS